jgi:hypothetical protein
MAVDRRVLAKRQSDVSYPKEVRDAIRAARTRQAERNRLRRAAS